MANIALFLWKARNEAIFTTKKATPDSILAKVKHADMSKARQEPSRRRGNNNEPTQIGVPVKTEVILVDASWEGLNRAGWGAVSFDEKGELRGIGFGGMRAIDLLQAEALAMLKILELVLDRYRERNGEQTMIMSDCQVLINAIHKNSVEEILSWGAASAVEKCGRRYSECNTFTTIVKATREMVKDAHNLANLAQRTGREYQGTLSEVTELNFAIQERLNQEVFQRQQS